MCTVLGVVWQPQLVGDDDGDESGLGVLCDLLCRPAVGRLLSRDCSRSADAVSAATASNAVHDRWSSPTTP